MEPKKYWISVSEDNEIESIEPVPGESTFEVKFASGGCVIVDSDSDPRIITV
jgi:hypothetical protein